MSSNTNRKRTLDLSDTEMPSRKKYGPTTKPRSKLTDAKPPNPAGQSRQILQPRARLSEMAKNISFEFGATSAGNMFAFRAAKENNTGTSRMLKSTRESSDATMSSSTSRTSPEPASSTSSQTTSTAPEAATPKSKPRPARSLVSAMRLGINKDRPYGSDGEDDTDSEDSASGEIQKLRWTFSEKDYAEAHAAVLPSDDELSSDGSRSEEYEADDEAGAGEGA
ncbi:hypothetical protein BJ508DRAFT_349395 [Ascobolus immersus RN42]|uniref:Uncharacterized protein n=1 Tax=Ascobolus immersus RN42 TaxID=1160509 RepID=A0A3N4HXR6_ASCIM|nr:hypothetical protein BJ508DRAFT_349395 [Ascobolus immersus RN42]